MKRADKDEWNISEGHRKRLINMLKGIIDELEHDHHDDEPDTDLKQKS